MDYDIRLVKLVSGDMVVGKFDEAGNKISDPASIQAMPTQQGTQMVLLPFGYPFDQEMHGEISINHVLFQYKNCPEELKDKYLEALTNISLSSGGLDLSGGGMGGGGGLDLG
jgi:inosine-uridine nucleoside N-ribohydrolase